MKWVMQFLVSTASPTFEDVLGLLLDALQTADCLPHPVGPLQPEHAEGDVKEAPLHAAVAEDLLVADDVLLHHLDPVQDGLVRDPKGKKEFLLNLLEPRVQKMKSANFKLN